MATEVQNHPEQSVASLVGGIVGDVQDLIKQQLALTRKEIEADIRRTRVAALVLFLGIGLALFGCFAVCLMLAHLVHHLTTPVAFQDAASIPLWGCYGIVGAVLSIAGGALAFAGKKKFDSFNPLPDESAQVLKENIEWITNKK
jgi:hypothetical protein